jgi:hypothetical protein
MTLPDTELSFYFAAVAQLDPKSRPVFMARLAEYLQTLPDPGPGDLDRALRAALVGLWTPPELSELRPARWDRGVPAFERASKRAW